MRFARGLGRSAGIGGLAAEILGQVAGVAADVIAPQVTKAAKSLLGARAARAGGSSGATRNREARQAAEFLRGLGMETKALEALVSGAPPVQAPPIQPGLGGRGVGGRGVIGDRFSGGNGGRGGQPPPASPGSPIPPQPAYPAPGRQFAPAGTPPKPGEDSPFAHEVYTPQSSNVFAFAYDPLTSTLYVTFKAPKINPSAVRMSRGRSGARELRGTRGKTVVGKSNERGPMYAYFDVPVRVFQRMQLAASKGKFVWDELRIRGTVYGHQYRYRLIQGSVTPGVGGVYIPRRATSNGFRTRSIPVLGTGKRGYSQSTLPDEVRNFSRVRDRSGDRTAGRDRSGGRGRPGG